MILFLSTTYVYSAQATLAWNPNSESVLAGYKIYYGNSSGNYDTNIDVGNQSSYTISGLVDGNVYYFAATAYDFSGNESAYSEEAIYNVSLPTNGIIDNDAPGTSYTGGWIVSSGPNPYGSNSLYSNGSGDTYTFQASGVNDTYEVSLWWTYYNNRCDSVPVDIYDGNSLIDTVYVDQLANGGQWNVLGTYGFNGTARVVINSQGSCTTSADAVKFVIPASNPPVLGTIPNITVTEGDTVTLNPTATDPDGDTLTYTYSGWMTSSSYTTNYNDSGTHTVTVTVSDGTLTDFQVVTIIVNDVDTTPPAISSVNINSPTQVNVVFSEPVEESSSTDVLNYSIDNAITVFTASLGSDLKTVTLTTSELTDGVTYILTVNNIMDLASTPNMIAPNTTASFTFVNQFVISNLTVESGRVYEIVENGLQNGAMVYIDRESIYNSVPTLLKGATYIKTANNDKGESKSSFLTFDVNQDVTVYVAHDDQITKKPSWLTSFTDTGNDLVTMDTTLSIFANNFLAGTITLGGNEGKGNRRMYTVIILKYDGSSGGGCTDADGDGWCIEDGDCDDADPNTYPGATEFCDGIDNNCDGVIDEGCGGGYTDNDGDGWSVEDGDCDDNDRNVYPGHNDTKGRWGRDGVDNDCNGIIDG